MDNADDDATHKATPSLGEDANGAIPPLDAPLVDLHPELPEWNVAFPVPESFGSIQYKETFNNIVTDRQAEESAIIESVVEDYTLEADASEAEVIDTNTIVSKYIIAEWKSQEVIAPDGSRHDKQTLLKSIYLPDGMVISSSINALSID
jgi:hypothetical protein